MHATINFALLFYAVPDNPALAMGAGRRQRLDRAFEAVEDMTLAGDNYFECLVVLVFANFAFSHTG